MAPAFEQSKRLADENDLLGILSQSSLDKLAAITPIFEPWRKFMQLHTGKRELLALSQMVKVASKGEGVEKQDVLQADDKPADPDIIAWRLLLPAFVLSELKQAFTMGFVLLLPFLVIDLIVANILVGLNMIMVSPIMVALPLKLILFVMSDGWLLITKGLINSYNL
jgi:flagellar biosynthetic protein FliP